MAYTSQLEQIAGIRSIARTLTGGDAELSITSVGGTPNIGASLSNRVLITGTTTITSFGSVPNIIRFVRFAGILTLTHNATTLVLPTGTNITTAADDIALFTSDASGNWRLISYNKANGQALVGSAGGSVIRQSYTATAGQTSQTVSGGYTAGLIDVYINGSKLVNGDDVIVTSGTSVTFTIPLIVGDAIDIIGSLSATGAALLTYAVRQSLTPSTEGQTVFTISGGYAANALDVYYNGSKLQPVTDVTTSSGSTITLQFPSTLTDVIDVVGQNVLSAIGSVSRQSFIATAGQTVFAISGGYQAGAIDVYQNGVKLQNGVDVTVTGVSGNITLAVGASLNDIIDVCASQNASPTGFSNLGTTQTSTTVTVTTDNGGGSAVLPSATTTTAGIMSAADKVTLRNYGMKNRIINGGMQIAQRGNVAAVNSTYTYGGCDRMVTSVNSLTSGTIQQIPGGAASGVCGYNHAVQCTTSTAGSVYHQTRIESKDTVDLNSRTITISCKIYQDTGSTISATIELSKPTTTVDTFSAQTILQNSTISLPTGVLTTITLTRTMGSTEASLGLSTHVFFTLPSAVTSKYFTVTDWQLELGSQATEFEHRPIGVEMQLCERYREHNYMVALGSTFNTVFPTVHYRATKRTNATITLSSGTMVAATSTMGFYQNGAHSGGAAIAVTAYSDCEL